MPKRTGDRFDRDFWSRRDVTPISDVEVSEADETEFLAAIDQFKDRTSKRFPTWTDILRVAKSLGYEKTA